jgi:ribonuclease T2
MSDLIDRLNVEWPSLLREDNDELWKEEWENHGICSEAMLPQHAFFKAALKLKDKYRLVDMLAEKGL